MAEPGDRDMPKTTLIKNADWVIAWDAAAQRHAYLTGADVVFTDDAIAFVGRQWQGKADETINGRGLMGCPASSTSTRTPISSPSIAASARSMACPRCICPASTSALSPISRMMRDGKPPSRSPIVSF
jgi:hypothetical protein